MSNLTSPCIDSKVAYEPGNNALQSLWMCPKADNHIEWNPEGEERLCWGVTSAAVLILFPP